SSQHHRDHFILRNRVGASSQDGMSFIVFDGLCSCSSDGNGLSSGYVFLSISTDRDGLVIDDFFSAVMSYRDFLVMANLFGPVIADVYPLVVLHFLLLVVLRVDVDQFCSLGVIQRNLVVSTTAFGAVGLHSANHGPARHAEGGHLLGVVNAAS